MTVSNLEGISQDRIIPAIGSPLHLKTTTHTAELQERAYVCTLATSMQSMASWSKLRLNKELKWGGRVCCDAAKIWVSFWSCHVATGTVSYSRGMAKKSLWLLQLLARWINKALTRKPAFEQLAALTVGHWILMFAFDSPSLYSGKQRKKSLILLCSKIHVTVLESMK